MAKKLNRLLITGASGALGSHCRQHLKDIARIIRVTDRLELAKSEANQSEEIIASIRAARTNESRRTSNNRN
mgnify:CR=1 FL=1